MTPDDVNYALLLLLSLPLSCLIKYFKSVQSKRLFISSVGIAFVAITCGYNSFHSAVTVLVNYVIVSRIRPRYIHILSYIWCFGYLTFFRLCHLVGLPKTGSFMNAIQLLLTLKMVGIAFEIHDWRHASPFPNTSMTGTENSKLSGIDESLSEEEPYNTPSFLEFLSYSYCFIGLLTGPYFKFETFEDMVNSEYNFYVPVWGFVWKRNSLLPLIVAIFLTLSHYFKLEYMTSEWFLTETTFIQRIVCMMAMFAIFRTRLYLAWYIAETACMLARLGAYPVNSLPQCGHGPTSKSAFEEWKLQDEDIKRTTEFNFETIKCIDLWGCELAPTIREGMKSWNMTVQYWLANFVYKRTRTLKNYCIRITITMMVSAYWHGIHPGYYLSFIIIPFCLMAESQLSRAFNRTKWSGISVCVKFYRTCLWIIKMRLFEYMCMGFLLLSLEKTITFWRSIYFCGHVLIIAIITFGWLVNKYIDRYKSKHKNSN